MCWLCMSYASVQHLMEGGYICVQKCSVNTHRESKLIHCCGWNNTAIKCLTAESPLSYPWQLFTFLSSWCRGLPNYNVAIFSSPPPSPSLVMATENQAFYFAVCFKLKAQKIHDKYCWAWNPCPKAHSSHFFTSVFLTNFLPILSFWMNIYIYISYN